MADEPSPKTSASSGVLTKIVAGIFASIIAPITVAVGIQWANKLHTPEKADTMAASAKDAAKEVTKDPASKESPPKETTPKAPVFGVTDLITPKLSDYFYQYAWSDEEKKDVRSDAIDPQIFRYEDKPGRLFVVGAQKQAILTTKEEYEDYTLTVWYRWGENVYAGPKDPPDGYPRKGSIGLHGTGAEGTVSNVHGQNVAIRLGEGQAGTINLVGQPGVLTCKAKVVETKGPDGKTLRRTYSPDAPAIPIASAEPETWVPPFLLRRGFPESPVYKAGQWIGDDIARGWHPPGDPTISKVFPPYGPNEWNKVRIDCHGATVKVFINNKVMNEITDLNIHRGRIGLSSMNADWEIGRFEIETKPAANTAKN